MSYDPGLETVRAPLYGIGGLLGVTLMVLLLVGVPAVRWFALLSIPLGIVMAAGMRLWWHLERKRARHVMWQRDVRRFRWPQPIS